MAFLIADAFCEDALSRHGVSGSLRFEGGISLRMLYKALAVETYQDFTQREHRVAIFTRAHIFCCNQLIFLQLKLNEWYFEVVLWINPMDTQYCLNNVTCKHCIDIIFDQICVPFRQHWQPKFKKHLINGPVPLGYCIPLTCTPLRSTSKWFA